MPRRPPHVLVCVGLVAAVALVYGQVGGFSFIGYDDNVYVYENPRVLAGPTAEGIAWAFTSIATSNWHPLTWISLMIDAGIGGASPRTFHLSNLLLHLANTLLVYALFATATRRAARSALVAALFGVHPLHVESVAWVSERKDLLSTLFWLLTMLAYLRHARQPTARRFLPVVLFQALGLMAKPMLVTAPVVLLLLDFWPLRRAEPRLCLLAEKIPLFVLSILSGAVTVFAQRQAGALGPLDAFPLGARIANAIVSYATYLWNAVWPARLAIFYPHPGDAFSLAQVLGSGALLAGVTTFAVLGARRRPYFVTGWLWYVVTLAPVIGIVQVGLQARADRYTYVPLLGIFVMVAWGVPELLERLHEPLRGRTIAGAAAVVVLVLGIAAHGQVAHWRDGVTLFSHAIRVTSDNAVAECSLGSALHDRGNNEEAVRHWREAIRIVPEYVDARSNLAGALIQLGKVEEGVIECRKVLEIDPDHVRAHTNLGIVLLSRGEYAEAAEHFFASLRGRPGHLETESNLGLALLQLGRFGEAALHLSRVVGADPGRKDARLRLSVALANAGRPEEAIAQLEVLLRADPNDEEARRVLALVQENVPGKTR